jgi:beta-glucanase (GH16 family)/regulation of enolase protein 1 (concanavalin A-like superfamily)
LTFKKAIMNFLVIVLFASAASLSSIYAAEDAANDSQWTLVWNDEFNSSTLDESKWNYTTGGGGYGNHELQNYTNRPENVRVENGQLIIEARKESYQGSQYTSGKLETKSKGDWKYGRYEIRAKLPEGKGMWPAIWMMPTNQNVYGGWPVGGEIDIMEFLGHDPGKVYGTIHYGNPWTHTGGNYTLPNNQKFSDDFHTFSLEWSPGEFKWYVDGILYLTKNDWFSKDSNKPSDYPFPAPFDQLFYLQLNLAVGGDWPGNPDATTDWTKPKQMLVDYVRVYRYNGQYPEPGPRPGKSLGDGWSWVREISSNWYAESSPDAMRLTTIEGSWGGSKPSNILLRDPGTSDFTISTKIKFDATYGFEWAGLIVYQDDGNAITLGRQANGANPGASKQLRFSQIKNGAQTDRNYADLVTPADIFLKIEKSGTIYKGYYSSDGNSWTQVTDTFDISLTSPKVGIFTRKFNTAIPVKTAEFTNFTLNGSKIPFAKAPNMNVTAATLTGPEAVYPEQPFDLTVGVSSLLSSFTTLQVVLTYDPNLLEFDTVTHSNGSLSLTESALSSLRNHFNVLGTAIKADKGQILIIMASEGNDNAISTIGDLYSIRPKTKAGVAAGETTVSLSDFIVSFAGSDTPVTGASLSIQLKDVDEPVDKSALSKAITAAQSKYDAVTEGTKIGQYPAAARAALLAVITSANAVLSGSAATQTQVDTATTHVNTALETFLTNMVTLVPGQTSVTINDLSVISKYYGTKSTDANWSEIEAADIFHSGEIDIQVLAAVARMIIDNWLSEN